MENLAMVNVRTDNVGRGYDLKLLSTCFSLTDILVGSFLTLHLPKLFLFSFTIISLPLTPLRPLLLYF
ncbi:uncharacterized protein IAS62_006634 [Cryptococcus decagattii]|uniref:Transmembrane protein n=1 Tax=Cryptococcus decagattii TaxID=1859122 RepID=A0ABZ2B386_9TREE